jgi:hypothetical protein
VKPIPRDENRAAGAYQDRILAGRCVAGRCTEPAIDGADRCAVHRAEQLERQRAAMKKLRRRRRRVRQCAEAGCANFSRRFRCRACARLVGNLRAVGVKSGVNRTWKEADGRTRFHGQESKGRQTNAALDAQDLTEAIRGLTRGRDDVAHAAGPEAQARPKAQRDEMKRAALSRVAYAIRFAEEVLERHGYEADLAAAAPRPK